MVKTADSGLYRQIGTAQILVAANYEGRRLTESKIGAAAVWCTEQNRRNF